MAGNFLKLYLSETCSIGEVIMVSRSGDWYVGRMVNTEVRVYSTEGGESEVASCGTISGSFLLTRCCIKEGGGNCFGTVVSPHPLKYIILRSSCAARCLFQPLATHKPDVCLKT